MRISGGTAKGRKVAVRKAFLQKGSELRPTSAKVRKAIFDILTGKIEGAVFLDLYAGTGAVGIEALSRGAAITVFVDEDSKRVNAIKELTERFGFKGKFDAVKDKAINFLKKTGYCFDIIFVDPPYDSEEIPIALSLIEQRNLLKDEGVIIAEHSSKKNFLSKGNLKFVKKYRYGDTTLSLFRKENE